VSNKEIQATTNKSRKIQLL